MAMDRQTNIAQMTVPDRSMKILHILDHSLPLYSGYAFRSQNIFRALRKRDCHPVILTSPKHEASWKEPWTKEEVIDGFRYYRTGAVSANSWPLEGELRLMLTLARRIREVIQIERPALLHAHSPVLNAIPALWVGRQLGLPVVYEVRALWEDAAVDHGTYRFGSWKYNVAKSLETWVCHKADEVVVLCRGLRDDLINRGIPSAKLTIAPNAVNIEDFNGCNPKEASAQNLSFGGKRVIGFIGSFYRYEGLDLLIEAFALLASTRSDIVLLLVGGGEMDAEIIGHVERHHLQDKVVMPGRISHDRIPEIYGLLDMVVCPRHSNRLTELVTPLKPLEAMAMRKAVVASDVGGHRELIQPGQTGLLFPAGNPTALADTIAQLLDNHALRKALESQAASWVASERSWDLVTCVYPDIYARALEEFPSRVQKKRLSGLQRLMRGR